LAEDFYSILGVAKDASMPDIKRAFRQLARECHPDVAGEDAAKVERFKKIREAYEVLSDPVQRSRYDRRGERRTGPFLGSSWDRVSNPQGAPPRPAGPGNQDLDLEDLLSGFSAADFGFGGRGNANQRPTPPPPPKTRGVQGKDIHLTADVPEDVAQNGGIVTLSYKRLRRGDDGESLHNYDELYDLRVPPQTSARMELRVRGMGDAGAHGGAYGELVCSVRIIPATRSNSRMKMPWGAYNEPTSAPEAPRATTGTSEIHTDPNQEVQQVSIGITEAILGGRVEVPTPAGTVRISIPAGTDSGTRLRLRGRGSLRGDGSRHDLYAEIRIVVPKHLDAESRSLIERFGALNPLAEE
jgi:DnaJ-class molecular chaperone